MNVRTTIRRFVTAAVAAISLTACQDTPVAPDALGQERASLATSQGDYQNFNRTYAAIFFARLPCENGVDGEFVRVSGAFHVWGRLPSTYDGDPELVQHYNFHSSFEGTGVGQTTGRVFDVTIREVDMFNGATDYGVVDGTANWRARLRFIDQTTGQRYDLAFFSRLVITPNGDLVVDRIDSPPACD